MGSTYKTEIDKNCININLYQQFGIILVLVFGSISTFFNLPDCQVREIPHTLHLIKLPFKLLQMRNIKQLVIVH